MMLLFLLMIHHLSPLANRAEYVLSDLLEPLDFGLQLPDPSILIPDPCLKVTQPILCVNDLLFQLQISLLQPRYILTLITRLSLKFCNDQFVFL
ncbi:hypothetical protein FGO68_gene9646 [Halteria grandinella]|uniref:Secreted protein n=1 Tax=Halteria grandinella TaxID=5974 RepID=A0A8J8T9Q5_HALGN|nr:hypothetical protein FGO68_gene9646 [Halteria grandinella]